MNRRIAITGEDERRAALYFEGTEANLLRRARELERLAEARAECGAVARQPLLARDWLAEPPRDRPQFALASFGVSTDQDPEFAPSVWSRVVGHEADSLL